MIRIGILGAAGYTGGELIRLLVHHPEAEIVFACSESHAGAAVSDVHEGLVGDTDLSFAAEPDFGAVDVVFFCFGHGKSEQYLAEHAIPSGVRIIDLAQDFRVSRPVGHTVVGGIDASRFVYGLPELQREAICGAQYVANPGCFATAIQLALLPALKAGLISGDVHINGITGSTGAGQKPGATTHFSWRNDNISVYKTFTHQHLHEIRQTVGQLQPGYEGRLLFIPQRGCFTRGIFVSAYATCTEPTADVSRVYADYYASAAFTHAVSQSPNLKQVVGTNKGVVYVERYEDQLLAISCIDNLLKGAVGQAVQNMNLMFGLAEDAGLRLKATAF